MRNIQKHLKNKLPIGAKIHTLAKIIQHFKTPFPKFDRKQKETVEI